MCINCSKLKRKLSFQEKKAEDLAGMAMVKTSQITGLQKELAIMEKKLEAMHLFVAKVVSENTEMRGLLPNDTVCPRRVETKMSRV